MTGVWGGSLRFLVLSCSSGKKILCRFEGDGVCLHDGQGCDQKFLAALGRTIGQP